METRGRRSLIAPAGIVLALLAGGCADLAALNDLPPPGAGPVTATCTPSRETEDHSPGDPGWIGHDYRQLQATLGREDLQLYTPSSQFALVYDRGRGAAGCVDAYVVNACGTISAYHCR